MRSAPVAVAEADETSAALRLCALELADLDRIEALHRLSMGPEPRPDVVKPEKRSFFAGILGGRGRVWGLFEADALVAYAILQHDLLPEDDPRPLFGLPAGTTVAKLAGAAVAPAYRGHHLQRRLIALRAEAAADFDLLISTAAPLNVPSWVNLISEGFCIRAVVARYGGLVRFLLARERARATAAPTAGRVLAPLDLDGQRALLAAGWRGTTVAELDGAPAIRYVPVGVDRGVSGGCG